LLSHRFEGPDGSKDLKAVLGGIGDGLGWAHILPGVGIACAWVFKTLVSCLKALAKAETEIANLKHTIATQQERIEALQQNLARLERERTSVPADTPSLLVVHI
jgi:hypothetical protein